MTTADPYPLVSIAMPVRNGAPTVGLAIRSILRQTYPHWELLAIDDGSTDDTLDVLRRFDDPRIHVAGDGGRRGRAARRNQTIELSQGTYYACMDSDDVAYPRRLEQQVDHLQRHPEIDLVGSGMLVFGANGAAIGKRVGPERHAAIVARPIGGIAMMQPTFLGRIEFFRRHRYRDAALFAEDQDLLLRSYLHGTFANLPDILVGYRESTLRLDKLLPNRYHFAVSAFRAFGDRKRYDLAARAIAEQSLKAAFDAVALGTRLNHRLLRHRARPLTPSERGDWDRLWAALGGDASADRLPSPGDLHAANLA